MWNVLLPLLLSIAQDPEGGLARHAMIGAAVESLGGDSAGVRVTGVSPGYTAASLGLQPGDIVLTVDGERIGTLVDYARAFRALRAPGQTRFEVRRDSNRRKLRGSIVPRPREEGEGLDVRYESIVSDSADRVRTIITRPRGVGGRLPAILLVGWLSCSSVELPVAAGLPGWRHLIHGLSRAGYLVQRVEKPGVGDSQGPDCSELGLGREVAAYRAGLKAMQARPDVDPDRVFVFGASLGGAIAPGIAAGRNIRGIVVFGTFSRTWYEHMLGHERRRLELSGVPFPEIQRRMQMIEDLYGEYLIDGRQPGDIVRARPEYAAIWTDLPGHQYGRPARFFHDVQRLNVAASWDSVRAPVLVLYGSNDWVMAREEHQTIVRMVNARAPGSAELVVLDGMDHSLVRYASLAEAFAGEGGEVGPAALEAMTRWLADPGAGPPADSSPDRAEILAVLDRLTQAMERRDTALLTSVFAPGARLVGIRPGDGGGSMQTLTVQRFAEFLANDKRDRWVERLHQPEVRIEGTLATVWAGYDFSFGTRRSHCGTDAFQLLRTAEGWKIVSLADTYRTEGCG